MKTYKLRNIWTCTSKADNRVLNSKRTIKLVCSFYKFHCHFKHELSDNTAGQADSFITSASPHGKVYRKTEKLTKHKYY